VGQKGKRSPFPSKEGGRGVKHKGRKEGKRKSPIEEANGKKKGGGIFECPLPLKEKGEKGFNPACPGGPNAQPPRKGKK